MARPLPASLLADPQDPVPDPRPGLPGGIQMHLAAHLRAAYGAIEAVPLSPGLGAVLERLTAALAGLAEGDADAFGRDLLDAAPRLRRRALTLAHDPSRADDLVQETLLKAWQNRARFEPGTNLDAWLYTILRNSFYSEYQKRTREVADSDGVHAARLIALPAQEANLDLLAMQDALDRLGPDQREALLLSAVHDLSYEDIAVAMACRVGTVKSRINRARARLTELLG
ncbi:sigma-70 family RNA polymerase sigma factor [uncultured Methylobacterium sp.]|jgi:RNA polymerase sigma-70 factor (ECF subfamily)|uniref:sigma-70 family RNA polymerase sigma factor n=1 Tax=uncultured Methylobacterium sp. TaxID=157278 RepID=UPI00262869E4|nr:sigma-70 family RNA polymerase sigma factor [uncultured Methylobacterium sp.]